MGELSPLETTIFQASELQEAFKFLSNPTQVSKAVISYEQKDDVVKVQQLQKQATFDPDASYLLVGCLGGLGTSLSYWMMERGAKNFVFLSRSGANNGRPLALLEEIRRRGGTASAVRGDVTKLSDVQRAINSALTPIKGVVQGVMTLRVCTVLPITFL